MVIVLVFAFAYRLKLYYFIIKLYLSRNNIDTKRIKYCKLLLFPYHFMTGNLQLSIYLPDPKKRGVIVIDKLDHSYNITICIVIVYPIGLIPIVSLFPF